MTIAAPPSRLNTGRGAVPVKPRDALHFLHFIPCSSAFDNRSHHA
jgi:hypothetical protein